MMIGDDMNKRIIITLLFSACFSAQAMATGLATCDSGPEEGWQKQEVLQQKLEKEGWEVRRIKMDGGCYEVYALDAEGNRLEAYFHPVTLDRIPIEDHH